ncbi:MAG: HRDC domain-containing protein [Planctomycetota bacterium]
MDLSIDSLPPPTLVETDDELERLLDVIDEDEAIAVDTEADSFYSYRDKVCLFQVTAGGEDWLVDPLSGLDLTGLGDVMADPDIVKVFHDAEYDVLILKREFDFGFRSLFDTRVAAAVLGSAAPGLASVLESRFGVKLDKSQQRSDWSRRPLSPKQIAYARLDTRFLLPLRDEQEDELERTGLAMIVDTECRRLEGLEPPPADAHPDGFVRVKGARDLDPKGASALRELWAMREKVAEKYDRPPFRILGNSALLEIARRRPRNEKELLRVDGITPKVLGRVGDRIQRALDRAHRKGPLDRLPPAPRRDSAPALDEIEGELADRLKRLRRDAAEEDGIESAYLINRHVLAELARARPRDMGALEDLEILEEWQLDRFGDSILDTVEDFERDVQAGRVPARRRRRR